MRYTMIADLTIGITSVLMCVGVIVIMLIK